MCCFINGTSACSHTTQTRQRLLAVLTLPAQVMEKLGYLAKKERDGPRDDIKKLEVHLHLSFFVLGGWHNDADRARDRFLYSVSF